MANYQLAKSQTFPKYWLSTLNSLEMQLKKQVCPQNSNLYAYAANNPVRYIDPDGNDVLLADYNRTTNTMTLTYYKMDSNYRITGVYEYSFKMTNDVRNELNGKRVNPDVKTTPSSGKPNWYFPRWFPKGLWKIGKSIPKDGTDPYIGDVFIPTNAHQEVPVYGDAELPMPSEILEPVDTQDDTAYGFHFSASSTTLGCGKGDSQEDINKFARWSDQAIDSENGEAFVYVHD